ncbi:hypothetical protein SynRCC2555_02191 [Synechococcus sp. WH 8101]|uniref:hypothetical protein n=1 Tax=Synechococcus sp. WH 8101 TaxID=59932 RepID=UPI0013EE663E|nr:hypothetical protein [Synechococcus sp. WH 8101]QNI45972.1 hypothetical protein SynRCC2555_02191 [Synechococcus sp. WH 8101]
MQSRQTLQAAISLNPFSLAQQPLRQRLLPQGDHLSRTCSFWAPTWQQQAGWAPEVA